MSASSPAESLLERSNRLSSICSLRPFTPAEAEEAVNTLLAIPGLLDALRVAYDLLDGGGYFCDPDYPEAQKIAMALGV